MDISSSIIEDTSGSPNNLPNIFENIINQLANTSYNDLSENNLIMPNLQTAQHSSFFMPPRGMYGHMLPIPSQRYIQRHHHQIRSVHIPEPEFGQPIANILTQSFEEKSKYKQVISSEGLKEIKFDTYKVDLLIKKCPITHEKFEVGEAIAILPCTHIFNKEAILTWVKEKRADCPICRYKFPSTEVKEEAEEEIPEFTDSFIIPRFNDIRQLLLNLIDERIQDEDDYNMQKAIIASLHDDDDD